MFLHKFSCGPLQTNAILFGEGGSAAVIDPSMGSAKLILREAENQGFKIEKILLTHSHWDHIADLHALKEKTGASVYIHRLDAQNIEKPGSDGLFLPVPISAVQPDYLLEGGETLRLGSLEIQVMHTPGHSPGGICFYLSAQNLLFSGDTLFQGCIGRLDLPTGDIEAMRRSLPKLAALPSRTRVVPGHGSDTEIGIECIPRRIQKLDFC